MSLNSSMRPAALAGFFLILFSILHFWSPSQSGSRFLSRSLNLYTQHSFGMARKLDRKIKLITFGDKSVAAFKRTSLTFDEWTNLFSSLKKVGVQKVIVDKSFMFNDSPEKEMIFGRSLKILGNVNAGLVLYSKIIPGFHSLNPQVFKSPLSSAQTTKLIESGVIHRVNKIPYGASPPIRSAFRQTGFLNIERYLTVHPILASAGEMVIPYLGATASDKLSVKDDAIVFNGVAPSRLPDGTMPFPLLDIDDLNRRSMSMAGLFAWQSKGASWGKLFDKGDLVVVLPAMYTGSTDFERSILGHIPRGFLLASFVNGVHTGNWVSFSLWIEWLAGVALIVLFVLLVAQMSAPKFYLSLLGALFLLTVGSLVLYAQWQIEVNWILISSAVFVPALLEHVFVSRQRAREVENIRLSLSQSLPDHSLKQIMKNPKLILAEPKESVLTVMFIDIASFSVFAEKTDAVEALGYLKGILQSMTEIVHRHDGFVDKSLGDGMLCVFGHDLGDGSQINKDQGSQAIECALDLQKMNVRRISENRTAPLPLRIGINTGKVYVGNLGGKRRTDYTVIGKSVNFAQRLEAACEQHKILVSQSTYEISGITARQNVHIEKRLIQIKHHSELIESVEIDPFAGEDFNKVNEVKASFRDFFSFKREDDRWPSEYLAHLKANSRVSKSVIIDFSDSGACLLFDKFFAAGVRVSFSLDSENGELGRNLAKHGLTEIDAIVKWGKKKEQGFIHGLHFDRLNADQKRILRQSVEAALVSESNS